MATLKKPGRVSLSGNASKNQKLPRAAMPITTPTAAIGTELVPCTPYIPVTRPAGQNASRVGQAREPVLFVDGIHDPPHGTLRFADEVRRSHDGHIQILDAVLSSPDCHFFRLLWRPRRQSPNASMSARLAVSDHTTCARGPSSRCVASSVCLFRPVSSTSTPSSRSAFTVARPMPAVPPVTTAFFPATCS